MSFVTLCGTCLGLVVKREQLPFMFNSCQDCMFSITMNYFFGVYCLNYCELGISVLCAPVYIATYAVMATIE